MSKFEYDHWLERTITRPSRSRTTVYLPSSGKTADTSQMAELFKQTNHEQYPHFGIKATERWDDEESRLIVVKKVVRFYTSLEERLVDEKRYEYGTYFGKTETAKRELEENGELALLMVDHSANRG